jgi:type IV/VI secretion system ImpK/VasF family protein
MNPSREETRPRPATREEPGKRDTLANLYQGFLTAIVRLQGKRQQMGDPATFRARMKTALKDARREAAMLGYRSEDIDDTEFAVVAFLDEVILTSADPGRDAWAKQTLSVEMYGEAIAGEVFFDKVDEFRRRPDSAALAALLEVYLLCLLLGFEGRYSGTQAELASIANRLQGRLDSLRQLDSRITPEAVPQERRDPAGPARSAVNWRRIAGIAVAGSGLLFLILKLNLWWGVRSLDSVIGR